MIIQNPNGNSYLFIDNKVFVSSYNETTKSVITVKLDLSSSLNDWEKKQIKKQPNHKCNNPCCDNNDVPFGVEFCLSCNNEMNMINTTDEI